jgi:hypothetical protein
MLKESTFLSLFIAIPQKRNIIDNEEV